MDEIHETRAGEADEAIRGDGQRFLSPDSALVRTALDLLTAHTGDGADPDAGLCAHCGRNYPCPTVQHARQVVDAGGMAHGALAQVTPDPVGAV